MTGESMASGRAARLAGLALGGLCAAFAAGAASADLAPEALSEQFPEADAIRESEVPGIYEVRTGYRMQYVDADGRYGFTQDLIDLSTGENLSEARRQTLRRELFGQVKAGEWDSIGFIPEDPAHSILVFTDISCGFCRQLHGQIGEYLARGIAVHYLAFPRGGPGAAAWADMEAIWCADDRQAAITLAKAGLPVKAGACGDEGTQAVGRQYRLGIELGLNGTPMLVLSDGRVVFGYRPPEPLLEILEGRAGP